MTEPASREGQSVARCSRCGREASTASAGDVCGAKTAKGNPCHGVFQAKDEG